MRQLNISVNYQHCVNNDCTIFTGISVLLDITWKYDISKLIRSTSVPEKLEHHQILSIDQMILTAIKNMRQINISVNNQHCVNNNCTKIYRN